MLNLIKSYGFSLSSLGKNVPFMEKHVHTVRITCGCVFKKVVTQPVLGRPRKHMFLSERWRGVLSRADSESPEQRMPCSDCGLLPVHPDLLLLLTQEFNLDEGTRTFEEGTRFPSQKFLRIS